VYSFLFLSSFFTNAMLGIRMLQSENKDTDHQIPHGECEDNDDE
jgi:hypothetical protein